MRLRHKPNAIPHMQESSYIIFNPEKYKGSWHDLFKNNNEIELEIGAGKGDFIVNKAMNETNKNFLALEMNTNAFVSACKKIEENDLKNVYGIVGKAEDLIEMFGENEVSKIYLNFSTPWPKNATTKGDFLTKISLNYTKLFVKLEQRLSLRQIMKYFLMLA